MTSKNKVPEGQIIVDVQDNGEVLINSDNFNLGTSINVLIYAVAILFHKYENDNNINSRKKLVDNIVYAYEGTKKELKKKEENKMDPIKISVDPNDYVLVQTEEKDEELIIRALVVALVERGYNDTVPLKELIKMVYDAYNETESDSKPLEEGEE